MPGSTWGGGISATDCAGSSSDSTALSPSMELAGAEPSAGTERTEQSLLISVLSADACGASLRISTSESWPAGSSSSGEGLRCLFY